ncbi:MAG TPA: nitrate reductase molybdenum cofactor assembly chaperone [Burkholderiales bacterium]|jgi:nitrate reductase delta subunit|nr:nitrate reductase molybdenum cofactor assembly chaperone [Burkholderiales bacterium]
MKSFKVLSIMLHYPSKEIQAELSNLVAILNDEKIFDTKYLKNLREWADKYANYDLITWQEEYVSIFDRNVSLYLFEYIHGQSKDRGQAMVDLVEYYQSLGFIINSNELPDYLPLILEFLSEQDESVIKEFLTDMLELISQIGMRLKQHHSQYAVICDLLLIYMGKSPSIKDKTIILKTASDIDKDWQEPPVSFNSTSGCNMPSGL